MENKIYKDKYYIYDKTINKIIIFKYLFNNNNGWIYNDGGKF